MAVDAKRERLEGLFTAHRIFELRRDPVRGSFDAAHLREINRRIFQDLPNQGFDVRPGQYRSPVEQGMDWVKPRTLQGQRGLFVVAYSSMDKAARDEIDTTLADINPVGLSTLGTDAFIASMADLYTRLDYLHPFPDGNSRTLRIFTEQLANEAGYALDWLHFASLKGGRNALYVARDLSVNRMALRRTRNEATQRDVTFTLDRLDGNRDLPDLLRDVIRPL